MRRTLAPLSWLPLLLGAMTLGGCNEFHHLEWGEVVGSRDGVVLEPEEVTIPIGIAVVAHPFAMGEGGTLEDAVVRLDAKDGAILGIDRVAEPKAYVLYGVSEGTTAIEVFVDEVSEGLIPVSVVPQ